MSARSLYVNCRGCLFCCPTTPLSREVLDVLRDNKAIHQGLLSLSMVQVHCFKYDVISFTKLLGNGRVINGSEEVVGAQRKPFRRMPKRKGE